MRSKFRYVWIGIVGMVGIVASIYLYFGGFGTGESADENAFAMYAKEVNEMKIPKEASVIALGEATHGNREFQELKKEMFECLVKENNVRAFAIEGDFGGCEKVNAYICGGEGNAKEAVSWIGFDIYRTKQMEQLFSYMRAYNENASQEEQLRFYGFDMQRPENAYEIVKEASHYLQLELPSLEYVLEEPSSLEQLRVELQEKQASDQVLHCVDLLVQYAQLKALHPSEGGSLRDQFMANNVEWIYAQEQRRGNSAIFITGHNSHVGTWGSYASMGTLLQESFGGQYYVVGTDFYKTRCNLPRKGTDRRTVKTFYSRDPFAKAAKNLNMERCWIDFEEIPEESDFGKALADYTFMGSLGESYSPLVRVLTPSYRIFQPPAQLYDSMIFVTEASPVEMIGK